MLILVMMIIKDILMYGINLIVQHLKIIIIYIYIWIYYYYQMYLKISEKHVYKHIN